MQPLTQQFIVRAHYIHAIVGACQRFLGAILVPEPGLFAHGVQYLTRDAPSAESTAECLTASLFLKETIARGARDYHIRFHEWYAIAATCEFQPHEFGFAGRPEGEVAGDGLNEWADAYDRQFDRRHAWPPALRAAALLRAQLENGWYIEELAAAVAVIRSTL